MLAWPGLLLIRGLGLLPLGLSRQLMRPVGPILFLLMIRRRRIAERNLELCFPELDASARRRLLRGHFRQLAESVAEIACAWTRRRPLSADHGEVQGLEQLAAARIDGRGVLLVTAHVTCLELAARLYGEVADGHGIYRPLRNRVLDAFQNRARLRYADGMIPRDNLRAMLRHLRSGGVLWYAADQDFGPRASLFAPFFGVPAATARAVVELAQLGRARVLLMMPVKDEKSGRIVVHIESPGEDFADLDPVAALTRINARLEHYIRLAPAQYWWLHRRFKTRPEGDPPVYD